jgi:fucose permease
VSAPPQPPLAPFARSRLAAIAYGSFLLIGWSSLLVPGLIRSVERDFAQPDAAIGVFYFLGALGFAAGTFAGGFATERFGRRPLLAGAGFLLTAGLALEGSTRSWELFLAAAVTVGVGSGVIDGGMNSLILDLSRRRPGGALNLLHLFFSIGAAASPLIVGQLVAAGADWRAIVLWSAGAAALVALLFATHAMPSGRRHGEAHDPATPANATPPRRSVLPLALLGVAIGCYVSAEIGTSSWLVRFLATTPAGAATATLSAFWAALALSRLIASRTADRFQAVPLATAAVLVAAAVLGGAVISPWAPASMALFAIGGFALGPVYPMIMSIGGGLYPRRLASVTGSLAGFGVVGGLIYPPAMGFISESGSIGLAMAGAAVLAVACGLAVQAAGRLAR